jgi:hypothetical protein
MKALDTQVGGSHYKDLKIQPVEYMHANKIPFIEGCIIKYATRWRDKGGIADLEKIKHFAQLLIDLEQESTVITSTGDTASPVQQGGVTNAGGWIKWDGGECPVDKEAVIQAIYRMESIDDFDDGVCNAGRFDWSHSGSRFDIIAYRIHKAGE